MSEKVDISPEAVARMKERLANVVGAVDVRFAAEKMLDALVDEVERLKKPELPADPA